VSEFRAFLTNFDISAVIEISRQWHTHFWVLASHLSSDFVEFRVTFSLSEFFLLLLYLNRISVSSIIPFNPTTDQDSHSSPKMDRPNPPARVAEAYVSHSTLIRDLAILQGTGASSFDRQEVVFEWMVRHGLEPMEIEGPMSSPRLWYLDKLLWKNNSRFP
jgi:hypothetical protein